MNRKSHIVIGIISSEVICKLVIGSSMGVLDHIGIVTISSIASTIPDIDLKIPFMGHRTWTHGLAALAITTVIASSFNKYIGLIWSVCYLSHLLADSLTVMGVPFLYPFIKKRYGLKIL